MPKGAGSGIYAVSFCVISDILISNGSKTGTLTPPYLRMFEINGMWFAAAELAGLDRLTFLASLHRYGVPAINLRDEEVDRELEAARRLGGK